MKSKAKKTITLSLSIFIMLLLLTPVYLGAINSNNRTEQKDFSFRYSLSFSEKDFCFENVLGYDTINYKDNGQLNEIGKPMLPIKNIMIALPQDITVTNIRIINKEIKEILGKYSILPVQPPQLLDSSIKKQIVTHRNNLVYQSSNEYPYESVKLIRQTDLAGQNIAVISIYPIHYIPSLELIKLTTSIEFVVEGITGNTCKDYLPKGISDNGRKMYQKTIEELVINPEDVKLRILKFNRQKISDDSCSYDYVIITNSSWVNAFQPLADWKTKKGIPAKIVTTDWIYENENYSGSNKEKIRAFIQDAHINWSTIYFLLGGDADYIPYHTTNYLGDNIPTDTYYSDYDDDWTCEVHVGRASVYKVGNGTGGIETFVNKSLTYEKNPPLTNYSKNISLFGFDLDYKTDGEDCKIDIADLYIPANWSISTVYDSHSGNHEDMVDQVVNNGQNLINHIDHSSDDYMGTGYVNHNWGLSSSEIDAFSNGIKQSIWYSIGCWACAYDYDNCIAEHFVRDSDGGGVAFIGNSRYGWYAPGYDDYYSLRYDRYFFRSFFDQNHYKLGDLFSDHKMDAYNSLNQSDYNKYIFTELTLLGDPELPLWKENPLCLNVTFPDTLPINSSTFTVHVDTSEGIDVNNSYICLWKDNEVYLTGYTDESGNKTFNPAPVTTGVMNVTVTKQNFLPFEGESEVILLNYPPYPPSDPNPTNGSTGVSIDADLSWIGGDPDDDPVTYDIYFGETNPPLIVVNNQSETTYDPGKMNYNTTFYWKIKAWDNSSEFNEGPIWKFSTEKLTNTPPFPPSDPNPTNGSTGVSIDADLSWTGGDSDGDNVSYDIKFGDTNPPSIVARNQTSTTYNIGTMEYNTSYYWQIVAWDTQGDFTNGPVWNFTTESNTPPNTPQISGPSSGTIDISYQYTFVTTDPNGDDVYYYVKWGDGQVEDWFGPYKSGEEVIINHTWTILGSYVISAKAKDVYGAVSEWGKIEVTMPKNKTFNFPILNWLFNRFPNAFPILRYMLGI